MRPLVIFALLAAALPARAGTVAWVDWTSSDPSSVYGTIYVDSATIAVTYTGERGFVQTTCGTDYWIQVGATNPYTSMVVDNPPNASTDNNLRCDIIALNLATSKTLVFSEPVTNPLFAVVSLNGNGYRFDRDFDILSFAQGYWGNGTLTKQVTTYPDGSVTYDVIGTGEPHGVLQFIGTFDTVTWDSLSNEFWNGFSIAVEHLAAAVPPEIEVFARGQPIISGQSAPLDFGTFDVGTSTTVELTISNIGTGPLNLSGIQLSGLSPPVFAIGVFPPAIAAGASAIVLLTFTASTAATSTATVTINSDDADEAAFTFAIIGRARIDSDDAGSPSDALAEMDAESPSDALAEMDAESPSDALAGMDAEMDAGMIAAAPDAAGHEDARMITEEMKDAGCGCAETSRAQARADLLALVVLAAALAKRRKRCFDATRARH